jgi:hypothetical protein
MANQTVLFIPVPFLVQGDGVSTSTSFNLSYTPTTVIFVSAKTVAGMDVSSNVSSVTLLTSTVTVNFVAPFSGLVTLMLSFDTPLSGGGGSPVTASPVNVENFPSSQTVTGTITANQGTSPWIVSLASTTISGNVGVTQSTSPWVVSNTGVFAVQEAALDGCISANTVAVSLASTTIAGTVSVTQSTSPWMVSLASTTITGSVAVTGAFFQATQPVSGTITANQGTSPWVVSLASTTITGSVAVTGTFFQATQPVSGTITANIGTTGGLALDATLTGGTQKTLVYDGTNTIFTGTHPGFVQFGSAQAVTLASTTITGSVAVTGTFFQATQPVSGTITANQGTSPWIVSLASTTITGTVAVTQSTSPWVVSNGGTFAVQAALNAETTKVIGVVRTSDGAGNLYTSNSTTPTGHFAQDSNITSILGTAPTTVGKLDVKGADGDVFVRQATAANLNATVSIAAAQTLATVTTVGTVSAARVVGNAGATLDAAIGGVAPTNAVWHTAAPATASAAALSATIISATGAKTLIKGSAGNLYGMYFLNNTAVASWIQFFNAATTGAVTLGTTAPVWAAPIAANGILSIPPGALALLNFSAGIVYAATSTLQGATTESMSGTVQFI